MNCWTSSDNIIVFSLFPHNLGVTGSAATTCYSLPWSSSLSSTTFVCCCVATSGIGTIGTVSTASGLDINVLSTGVGTTTLSWTIGIMSIPRPDPTLTCASVHGFLRLNRCCSSSSSSSSAQLFPLHRSFCDSLIRMCFVAGIAPRITIGDSTGWELSLVHPVVHWDRSYYLF